MVIMNILRIITRMKMQMITPLLINNMMNMVIMITMDIMIIMIIIIIMIITKSKPG